MVDIAQITQYFNLGLLALFISIAVGLFFAGLRGFLRGVWKSTHNMVFMLSLVFIAFFTLNHLTDIIGDFQISAFLKGSLYISREIEGELVTYYIPITTVKGTLTEFIKGFYTLYNVSTSAESAANFAIALTGSVLKVVLFIVDMILIMTLGNLFSFLTWYLIFRHFIPKVARKLIKIRWLGMIETALTYVVVLFLFMTPFTSLLNSLNQSYQKNRPQSDNEMVQNIGNFVDAYNDSLFAKILFNWTVDKKGMTLDTRLFDTFTTSVSGEYTIGLVGEIANITNLVVAASNGISSNSDSEFTIDTGAYISKDIVDLAFDTIIESDLLTTVLPVVVDIALNSDVLEEYVPNRLLDLSDVKWNEELGYVRDMVDCVFDSGAVDAVFTVDEEGHRVIRSFEGNDLINFFEDLIYDENFKNILDIFRSIDDSKVLSRAVPALLQFLISNDEEGNISKYLPFTWQELNEFSWGFESYILLDFLHSVVALDDDFLKAIFIQAGLYEVAEDESVKSLPTLISEHVDGFKALLVGEVNDAGELVNVDSRGQTIVFQDGTRLSNRNYCLFDMNIVAGMLPDLLDGLFENDFMTDLISNISDSDLEMFHAAVEELNSGVVLKNFKLEFNSLLDVVATLAKDEDLLEVLFNGEGIESLMEEEGNFFSIDETHIGYLQDAMEKMDDSKLLYSVVAPILKSYLLNEDTKDFLNDIGIRSDVLASAITHDMNATSHRLFTDFASIFDKWSDLETVYGLSESSGDVDSLMDKLKDRDVIDAFVSILNVLHDNPIINPTPQAGEDYEVNENIYGLLDFVFSNTADLGLTIERDTMREVENWNDEFNAVGDILHFIATHEITKASSAIDENGMTRSTLERLKEPADEAHPDNFDVPGLFPLIDNSHLFSTSLGPFLDNTLGDSLNDFLIDSNKGITFSNVTDWTREGQNIKSLLDSFYSITPEDDSEAQDFLSNLDINTLSKIVDLNDMLHNLAHSGIFYYIDPDTGITHYKFGEWMYGKIDSSMGDFSVDSNAYDLLADPKPSETNTWSWDTAKWGVRPEDSGTADSDYLAWKNEYNADGSKAETHYISYKDFVHLNGLDDTDPDLPSLWCNYDEYMTRRNAFMAAHEDDLTSTTTYLNNEWGAYYASDDFIAHYGKGTNSVPGVDDGYHVFEVDEISRVVEFMAYSMRVLNAKDEAHGGGKIAFNQIPKSLLSGLLTSLNDTYCLRIGLYNFYRIAAENVFDDYSGFSLSSAYNPYMIDADAEGGMFDYTHGRPNRQSELDKMINFYDVINLAKEKEILDGGNFQFSKMNDDEFMDALETAMKGMNDSFVFHRKGTAKINELTTFQGLFNHMLGESETKNVIFLGENSPKDKAEINKPVDERLYNDGTEKIRYLVTSCFLSDAEITPSAFAAQREEQQDEIHTLVNSIQLIYSLKDKDGNTVTAIDKADMKRSDNLETIESLFNGLNSSNLLYDCVPNTIYNMFIKDGQVSIQNGSDTVDFAKVDPYYHYWYNDTVKRSSVNYEARYLSGDINGIINLIEDYQEYNTQIGTSEISNPATLKLLTANDGVMRLLLKDMHACNLFHTPARQNNVTLYYTDKFVEDYTLFEEMMAKLCSFVKLDDFAYDDTYAPDLAFGSAEAKLKAHVKAVTRADDGLAPGTVVPYYHTQEGTAWLGEIDAMMNLANTAADLGSGDSLDISSFELDQMAPSDVKNMLAAVNASDLVSDAVPGFVSKGFDNINLGNLTTYNTQNYAYYRLGQEVYGGEDATAPEGTEIDNIANVLTSLYKQPSGPYITNMNNMTDFVKGEGGSGDGLNGLMKYIYDSHIFNTSLDGVYDEYNTVEGRQITAQGVLLFNSLGNDLSEYVARDANKLTPAPSAIDKISKLSHIIHLRQYDTALSKDTYLVEAGGIKNLITAVDGNIDASSFSSGSIEEVKARKDVILQVIETSYNALDESDPINYKRSAIVSEFISGVLNNILENEYTKLDNPANYPNYHYVLFSFGNDVDDGNVSLLDYASLNELEHNGLDGMISALDDVNSLALGMSEEKRTHLVNNLAKMGPTPGNNSKIAQVIYLTEAHPKFDLLTGIPNTRMEYFTPVDETQTDASIDGNIYSLTFCFKNYSQDLNSYLS